ncbi:serine protease gd-like [Uranotaenia lowii]|uniref:serine protease gd-like n=1 Tax=Uranotaenia lowii TaxID=190385 RepID=UPI00247ABA9D|nr:serine protease gd-like [Uranotaenia lowii]
MIFRYLLAAGLLCHLVERIRTQYLQSPCPDIFTYQTDPSTRAIFGYVEINNLQIGQAAKLNVDLSIGTELAPGNVGSVTLVKSREATFNDILHGQPAQYRVNFPLQNLIPTVLSIALNGQTICTGNRAQGRIVTTINLEHTLYTQLQSGNVAGNNLYGMTPVVIQPVQNTLSQQNYIRPSGPTIETAPQYPIQFQPQPQPQPQPQRPPTQVQFQNTPTRPPQQTTVTVARPQAIRTTVAPPVSSSNVVCGKASGNLLNRLSINGERFAKGQYPWIAPLFDLANKNSPKYICGSTIITKKHLITAAHCVYEIDDFIPSSRLIAMPGMYNIDNYFDENAVYSPVDEIIPNSDYIQDDDLNDADVAVLRLKRELVFSDYIIPVCFWQSENDLSKIVGEEAIVAGWGITESGPTSVPTFFKSTIVDRRQCNENLLRMYPSNSRIFCADGRGSTPCHGDSGSGLVIKRGNQYYLRGVVSKGQVDHNTLKCDATKFAIYTDIAFFRFWIKSVTS